MIRMLSKVKIFSRKIFYHKNKTIKYFLSIVMVFGLILNGFVSIFSISRPVNVEAADTTHKRIETFTTDGTFTVPSGVTSVTFEGWGGGGGGTTNTGAGGGGAYMINADVSVSATQEYIITVGTGGAAGGSDGEDTTAFRDPTTYLQAKGGKGGGANGGTGGKDTDGGGESGFDGGDGNQGTGSRISGGGAGDEGNGGSGVAGGTAGNFFGGMGGLITNISRHYSGGGGSTSAAQDAGREGLVRVTYDLDLGANFPVIKSRNWGRTVGTSHAIRMPSGITAGDLLIIIFAADDDGVVDTHSIDSGGWATLDTDNNPSQLVTSSVFYKIAAGGDTATVTTSGVSEEATHFSLRIANGGTPTSSSANGSSTNPNPPNHDAISTADYLWIAISARDMSNATGPDQVTEKPTGYSDFLYLNSGASNSAGVDVAMATKHIAADQVEDPGVFTAATEQWVTFTIAVPYDDNDAPLVTDFTPDDNATDVAVDANLVITFDEAVDAEAGADNDITIKTTVGDTTIETIDAQDAKVTGTGTTTITINPDATLSSLTEYYVLIGADAFDDAASNSYAGISLATDWSFTTADTGAPTATPSPLDNTTGVSATANLVLTFSEAVDAEAGADNDITIKTTVGDTTIETIDAQDAKVTGTGATTITINPDATLSSLTEYYVLIGADAFDDAASNSYAGISLATDWSFTTADSGAPTATPSPLDNATGVSATANLVLTFNEAVDAEAGADNDITIKTTVGDTTIETIDAQDAKVTGTGTTTITINPDATLSSL